MSKGSKHVVEWRRRTKRKAVAYLGGKCSRCQYNKSYWALSFHHKDRNKKAFNISHPNTKRWDTVKTELDKCELLCANCHMEEEERLYCGLA